MKAILWWWQASNPHTASSLLPRKDNIAKNEPRASKQSTQCRQLLVSIRQQLVGDCGALYCAAICQKCYSGKIYLFAWGLLKRCSGSSGPYWSTLSLSLRPCLFLFPVTPTGVDCQRMEMREYESIESKQMPLLCYCWNRPKIAVAGKTFSLQNMWASVCECALWLMKKECFFCEAHSLWVSIEFRKEEILHQKPGTAEKGFN